MQKRAGAEYGGEFSGLSFGGRCQRPFSAHDAQNERHDVEGGRDKGNHGEAGHQIEKPGDDGKDGKPGLSDQAPAAKGEQHKNTESTQMSPESRRYLPLEFATGGSKHQRVGARPGQNICRDQEKNVENGKRQNVAKKAHSHAEIPPIEQNEQFCSGADRRVQAAERFLAASFE